MDITVKFNNESFWEWGEWEKPFIKAVFEHANIKATEIYAEDMDEQDIFLRVKEIDAESGTSVENNYTIRYFDDDRSVGYMLLLYILYKEQSYCGIRLGYGVCQI